MLDTMMRSLLLCFTVQAALAGPEELLADYDVDSLGSPALGGTAPLTLLPQDKGDESPACLDGSPYGFYFVPSATNSTKWTIYIQGGGWCYEENSCYGRSQGRLGSSK